MRGFVRAAAITAAFVLAFVVIVVVLRQVADPICPTRAGLDPVPGETWPPPGTDDRCY